MAHWSTFGGIGLLDRPHRFKIRCLPLLDFSEFNGEQHYFTQQGECCLFPGNKTTLRTFATHFLRGGRGVKKFFRNSKNTLQTPLRH